ncbi:MAG: ABC transporter substrate-binding protein [Desulfobacteraceae bacterium]|nr:MAG: ABC transporter substrate-binding protein [Desulfobacteraceae bacterium]
MKRNIFLSGLAVILTTFFVFGSFCTSGAAGKPIQWKMTTTWTPAIQLIESDKNYAKIVNELAGDQLQIKFFDGGALVPPFQVFDAVSKGTIDAGGDWPNYWTGKDTVFDLLGSYPYGLTPIDYMVWIYNGGGFELYQEAYGKFGMVYLPHGVTPMESGVRGHKPINSIADYKGLKIRMSGRTQGKILQEIGAAQTMLAGGEIYQALEKGVIDAGEFCSPSIDWGMGFGEVTEYWATPGWHQPASLLGVMINKKKWDALPDNLKNLLKHAAMANFTWSFSYYEYGSIDGTKKFLDKGVKITRLSDEDLVKLQKMANKHTLDNCKENPFFAKVAYSQFKFLKDIAQWRSIASPFTYGRNPELPDLEAIKGFIK